MTIQCWFSLESTSRNGIICIIQEASNLGRRRTHAQKSTLKILLNHESFSRGNNWRSRSFIQFNSVAQSCPTLCDPMGCSTPGFPVLHQLLKPTQTHVHWVSDAIQPSHPLSYPSLPAFSLSQHHGLFKWVSSSHQVAKVLELQLQHQSFQWTPRTDLL